MTELTDDLADEIEAEIISIIEAAIRDHPRSQQKKIGPSEIGTPCDRRLGYILADVEEVNVSSDIAWRPTVGVAVHDWLADKFGEFADSYTTELGVPCFTLDGETHDGTTDVYGWTRRIALDWKITGPTTIKNVRAAGHPGHKYEVQINTYARGLEHAGYEIDYVAVMFLPSNGELHDRYFWIRPYNREIADVAIRRVREINAFVHPIDPEPEGYGDLFAALPTASDYCHRCPYFKVGSRDLSVSCPGDRSTLARRAEATSEGFLNASQ